MEVVSKEEIEGRKKEFFRRLKEEIFVHPTDTIYGIGCDATNSELVKKLRALKRDETKPFSVIIPRMEWIHSNCKVNEEAKKNLSLLPGPYTIVLPLECNECIAPQTNNYFDTLGMRLPRHWIADFVKEYGKPIVTTSANVTGENFISKIEDLSKVIKAGVGFAIDDGEIKGKPSQVIKFTEEGKEVLRD